MQPLTPEICRYAQKYCECAIRRMRIPAVTDEDVRDMVSYCLRKLVMKWGKHYDGRTRWKTYCSVILKTATQDARKWHYRQHQRLHTEELTEAITEQTPAQCDEVEDTIEDALDGVDKQVCLMRWQGASVREIRRTLGMSREEFRRSMERVRGILEARLGRGLPPVGVGSS